MANRFVSPNQQFFANPVTGAPLVGGFVYFYASGTSTPQNTYSDSALSVPNTNPVVLDSNGYANSIFLSNLAYKVVLTDENNVQLWTFDPVWTSDFSSYAQFQVVSGNPNGQLAGIAGTPGALPGSSVAWDYINDILYVCTTTGTVSSAVWTAANPTSASGTVVLPNPGGRLSPESATPVISTDQIGMSSFVYTPYVSAQIPIYNGTSFSVQTFSELTMNLTSSQSANAIYDVFVFNNSGVLTLVCGPAWSSATAGSSTRGTGAGSTQISRVSGIWTNSVSISAKNGATSYTIPANQATYVGSVLISGTSGEVSCYVSWGQSRVCGLWNAYNRIPIVMLVGDSTSSWGYALSTPRASNGNSANSFTVFTGLAEEWCSVTFNQNVVGNNSVAAAPQIGIGYNVTNAFSGFVPKISASDTIPYSINSAVAVPPALGVNIVTSLEAVSNSANMTFDGTEANMFLQGVYRG